MLLLLFSSLVLFSLWTVCEALTSTEIMLSVLSSGATYKILYLHFQKTENTVCIISEQQNNSFILLTHFSHNNMGRSLAHTDEKAASPKPFPISTAEFALRLSRTLIRLQATSYNLLGGFVQLGEDFERQPAFGKTCYMLSGRACWSLKDLPWFCSA